MLVVLLGSFANAQEANGLPTLAHVSGSNYTINGVSYTVEDTTFSNEVDDLLDGTFDFNLITWPNTDGGINIFHSAFANRTAEVTGIRNGVSGTLRFDRIVNEGRRFYLSLNSQSINPGNLLNNLYPRTTSYETEAAAENAARAIVDNNWDGTVLSIWTTLSQENLLKLANRPDITLYEHRTVSSGSPLVGGIRRSIGQNPWYEGLRLDHGSLELNGTGLLGASAFYIADLTTDASEDARMELIRFANSGSSVHRANSRNIFYWSNGEFFTNRPYDEFDPGVTATIIHIKRNTTTNIWELQPIMDGWQNGSLNDYIVNILGGNYNN